MKYSVYSRFSAALLGALFLSVLAVAGPGAPSASAQSATETMEARVARLPQGEEFDNNGFACILLPTLRAETQKSVRAPLAADEAESSGEEFARKGAFRIIRQSTAPSAATRTTAASQGANSLSGSPLHPVVFNKRTKTLGVVTRNLWLKLADMKDADVIAREYGLKPSFTSVPMQTAFYSAPGGIDLMQLRVRLQNDPRVLRVTLEVQDRIPRPR